MIDLPIVNLLFSHETFVQTDGQPTPRTTSRAQSYDNISPVALILNLSLEKRKDGIKVAQ
eukprot:m.240216 g.240216  ORF g.240216 m.240216 type:complete len:60 (-) comp54398_c0_seq10:35-214(-)